MNQKDMAEVIKGTQNAIINRLELDLDRLRNTVDHYLKVIDGLSARLKAKKEEVFAAEATSKVMEGMAVTARSAELELSHVLELVDDVLDETPVEDDSDAARELRLMRCTEADKEALIALGVIE